MNSILVCYPGTFTITTIIITKKDKREH